MSQSDAINAEHDTLSKKAGKSKVTGVQVFRGVNFDEWLRLFMQVISICMRAIMVG